MNTSTDSLMQPAGHPQTAAPLVDLSTRHYQSPLLLALQHCQAELQHIANQADMVLAVADAGSTILWTQSGRSMQQAAEQVHFVAGGQWAESAVGHNALALAIKIAQPSSVIAAEHTMVSICDWVCYAAPIFHPLTQQLIGVIDLSTHFSRQNQLGLIAATHCAQQIQKHLQHQHQHTLTLRALGTPQAHFGTKPLKLTPRQIEVLILLALHPKGLHLDQLHHALYGERKVSTTTLKAEISHLRRRLGGVIASRPYRLLVPISADFLELEALITAGYIEAALQNLTGLFMPQSNSPFLINWRHYLEARLSLLLQQTHDVELLLTLIRHQDYAPELSQRLMELIAPSHPIYQRLQADN